MTLAAAETADRLDRTVGSPRQGAGQPGERLRLRTLVSLRWGAVGGQMLALLVTRFLFGFDLPLGGCLTLVALAAVFNLALVLALPPQRVMAPWEAAVHLGFDVLQLGALLFLTGGLTNPFAVLLLVPAILAASSLKGRDTLILAGLVVATMILLAAVSKPLPWTSGVTFVLPRLYRYAAALALGAGVVITASYARRAAAESARMELALHAAESVLAREQRMSALGGLAAAAAHELGTPLATIAIVAKEMARESPPGPMREDAELVSSQAQRCRDILRRLAEAPDEGDVVHARVSLPQLLEEAAGEEIDSDEGVRVEWTVIGEPDTDPPEMIRHPEVGHALTSFIENAMDFAKTEVRVLGRYDYDHIAIEVRDDGPGFAPEIFAKLGEPYVTSRPAVGVGIGAGPHHLAQDVERPVVEHLGADLGLLQIAVAQLVLDGGLDLRDGPALDVDFAHQGEGDGARARNEEFAGQGRLAEHDHPQLVARAQAVFEVRPRRRRRRIAALGEHGTTQDQRADDGRHECAETAPKHCRTPIFQQADRPGPDRRIAGGRAGNRAIFTAPPGCHIHHLEARLRAAAP